MLPEYRETRNRFEVLIVGKGPTACPVQKSDNVIIAALNGAIKLVDQCDWLFVNDLRAFHELPLNELRKTKRIVVPKFMHVDGHGNQFCSWTAILNLLPANMEVYLYNLHTSEIDPHFPSFGRIHSVGDTALAWLIRLGYRYFASIGLGSIGYSSYFAGGPQIKKNDQSYLRHWNWLQYRVNEVNGILEAL